MLDNTSKKLTASIVTIIILIVCLAITSFSLIFASVAVENNVFKTGRVAINLNNGAPVINENEFLFEPGMTVEKEFFIENLSTVDAWYKLYFENIEGELSDAIDITVKEGDEVIMTGKLSDLTKNNVPAADDCLEGGEKKTLTMTFHFPSDEGNVYQNAKLKFDISAKAVQTKNNPDKEF